MWMTCFSSHAQPGSHTSFQIKYCKIRAFFFYSDIRHCLVVYKNIVFRSSGWKIEERSKPEVLGYQLSLGLEILLSRHRRGEEESGYIDSLFDSCQ